jgi:hypothetical protein
MVKSQTETYAAKVERLRKEFAPHEAPWRPPGRNEPPVAKPGWLTRIERDLCNADRGSVHQIMGEPGRAWEANPSHVSAPWKRYVTASGAIRSKPRTRWDPT